MKYIYFITLLILASTTLGSAQLPSLGNTSISQDCQNTLLGLLGNSTINSCFPFSQVAGLVTNGAVPSNSALASAADAICADPKCSNDVVSGAQATFQSGCKSDISNNVGIVDLVDFALTFYSPTRDSICFKNSTNGYCFIQTYTEVQQILKSAPPNQSPVLTFASAPQPTVCNPCNKAIANSYVNYINANPSVLTQTPYLNNQNYTSVKSALTQKCGQNFLDGKLGDSTEDPNTFQSQNTPKHNDATSLIANNMSFIVVLMGTILAIL